MNLIAVDDEPFVLKALEEALKEAVPQGTLHCLTAPSKAIAYNLSTSVYSSFLDIEMGSKNGLV